MPEFVRASIKKHVAIVPGNEFMVDSTKPCQSIRMNFSAASMENIEKRYSDFRRINISIL